MRLTFGDDQSRQAWRGDCMIAGCPPMFRGKLDQVKIPDQQKNSAVPQKSAVGQTGSSRKGGM